MITYEQYEADYEQAKRSAHDALTCFCVCGHVARAPLAFYGGPGLCDECQSERGHGHPRRPVETYDWDAWEAENGIIEVPQPTRFQRAISRVIPDRTPEAEAFARAYGPEGARFMVSMYERVMNGKPLTQVMVDAILRVKAADKRADVAADKRIAHDEMRHVKGTLDLNRVYIPEDVRGTFAVKSEGGDLVVIRIKTETDGPAHGFVMVEHVLGDDTQRYGVQYPQPWRVKEGYRQTYRGAYAHLVAQVVSNPAAAKALYEGMA